MVPVINLRHEPKLREEFEHAHVVNNTVLVDRRTRWGNPFRIGPRQDAEQAVARYRVHLWQRIRAGEVVAGTTHGTRRHVAGVLVRWWGQALPRRGAGPRRGLGRRRHC